MDVAQAGRKRGSHLCQPSAHLHGRNCAETQLSRGHITLSGSAWAVQLWHSSQDLQGSTERIAAQLQAALPVAYNAHY